jgi:uncharacterized protein (DUF1697 family)
MPSVVFLRAVNVGRTNRCQPAAIAKDLSKFDVVNIGAVGTFVVRKDVTEAALRIALARKLPFKCEIMICPAKEIVDLAKQDPLRALHGDDIDVHASILAQRPPKIPNLPLYVPSIHNWEIKIAAVIGRAVVCLRRRIKNGGLYPNAVVEKQFGVAATTRSWNTIEKVVNILKSDM